MSVELRAITGDEIGPFRDSLSRGFGGDIPDDDDGKGAERFRKLMPLERTVAAFDDGVIVGTLGDFPLRLTLPGGNQVDMAGTTMVTVQPTHTRRGVLRSMMSRHLDNAVGLGEPVAGLWASEPGIYGRFGFGLATECHSVSIDARHIGPIATSDDIELTPVPADRIADVVAPFWSHVGTQRSGFIDRTDFRWQDLAADPERNREGASKARHIVARRKGETVGYLAYRQRDKWQDFVADGTIEINALVATDAPTQIALWAFALDVDLFPNVRYWDGAVDDPLAHMVSNARAVKRVVTDALYVRVLDVAAALQARTYEGDGRVSMAITDDMGYAAGNYELVITNGVAAVEPTTDEPDVELDVRELGALLLGRDCAGLYAALGAIRGSSEATQRLGRLFVTTDAPWCPEMF